MVSGGHIGRVCRILLIAGIFAGAGWFLSQWLPGRSCLVQKLAFRLPANYTARDWADFAARQQGQLQALAYPSLKARLRVDGAQPGWLTISTENLGGPNSFSDLGYLVTQYIEQYQQALTSAFMTSSFDLSPTCLCNRFPSRAEYLSASLKPQPNVLESPNDRMRYTPAGLLSSKSLPRVPLEFMRTGL